jgi:hypothetical protein
LTRDAGGVEEIHDHFGDRGEARDRDELAGIDPAWIPASASNSLAFAGS